MSQRGHVGPDREPNQENPHYPKELAVQSDAGEYGEHRVCGHRDVKLSSTRGMRIGNQGQWITAARCSERSPSPPGIFPPGALTGYTKRYNSLQRLS
jgi:hypothetical protein